MPKDYEPTTELVDRLCRSSRGTQALLDLLALLRGTQALLDLLALLDNGGIGLDQTNQEIVVELLRRGIRSPGSTRHIIRRAVEGRRS